MLDVARQSNSIEDIRRCIQVCRAYKVRYLQLHMTDDQAWTFPSKTYAKLGTMNGSAHGGPIPQRYDLAELKALVKYADERGVTLVPELESPGHSSIACGTMPEVFGYVDPATGRPVGQGMMNIANPKLYEALDTIIGEMCDVFVSSPYFHIGFDEVSGLGNVAATPEAKAFMQDKGLKDANELMSHFALRVHEMVKKRGKTTIIWEGPANGVSKDIIHMTWDGNARTAERLVSQGICTITVPWNLAGVSWHEWTMYHSNGSVLKKGDPVLGAMLPVWEQQGEVNFRWLRGGLPKRQERSWGPDTVIDPTNFARRSEATDQVLDRLLYGFAIQQSPQTAEGLLHREVTVPTTLSVPTWPALGEVRLTVDGSEPTADSMAYATPIPISDNLTITARLFDKDRKPLAPAWSQPYKFSPLALQPEGLLPNSIWFTESMHLTVTSTMKTGTIRYTLDGSAPVATSTAYTKPIVLSSGAVVIAHWFDAENVGRGNVATATYRKLATVKHAAVSKPVTITVTAKLDDPQAAAKLLVDGVLGRDGDWGSPEVLRLGDSDLEAVIDLGESTKIRRVVGRFVYHQEAGIYPASRVDVFVSEDGRTFKPAGTTKFAVPQEQGAGGVSVREIAVESGAAGRYVKVFCKNNGLLPEWHKAPGVLGHLMMDEILVDPVSIDRP
jgi:hexosaminidase